MIFLIKDGNVFQELLDNTPHVFYINQNNKSTVSIKNLEDIIENNLYKNIFIHMPLYLDFFKNINFNKYSDLQVYMFINNLNYISPSLLIKSKVIMEKNDYYQEFYGEIEKFLNNKSYMINIPQESQLGALRSYLIKVMANMKNKDFLKKFVNELNNIFFYSDRKIQFQMLFILNEEMRFYVNNRNY